MNRIQAILTATWAMGRDDCAALMAVVVPSLQSGNTALVESLLEKPTVSAYASDLHFASRYELDSEDLPNDSVAVIQLNGMLYAWETFRLQQLLQQAIDNPRICGIVLWMNGPGGMILGLDAAAASVAASPKPVAAYIAGTCASAHYWLASAAGRRILGSQLCEVGSVGVMAHYYNATEALRKAGYDVRDIYPDSADLKNYEHRAIADRGDEKPYKEHLAKLHQLFCEAVATNLGIANDPESPVFRGATFTGAEAVEAKLADGFGTLEDAARWVVVQALNRAVNN